MTLSLHAATRDDFEFCASLNRDNMASYRSVRNIVWDPAIYSESWDAFENLVIVRGNERVGVLRLCASGNDLEIRDLQVSPDCQRMGVGAWALEQARHLAGSRGFHGLGLRVYSENPAVRLYQRHGFQIVRDSGGTLHMHAGVG